MLGMAVPAGGDKMGAKDKHSIKSQKIRAGQRLGLEVGRFEYLNLNCAKFWCLFYL